MTRRSVLVGLLLAAAAATAAVVLILLRGGPQPGPAAGQARFAERRRLLDRRARELASAVDAYAPADAARLDDLSRPAAEALRGLPAVARIDAPLSPARPDRRLVHLLDWHAVPRDHFAADVRAASGKPLSEAEIDTHFAQHLLEVEAVQLEQAAALRCLCRQHGLHRAFIEGLTERGLPEFQARVAALRQPLRALAEVRGLLRGMEARGADPERQARARAVEEELVGLLGERRAELLELGAAARLLAEGELEDVLPLDDAALLEAARPVAAAGKAEIGGPAQRAREDAMVRAALARGPFALVVLGGGHDLTGSVRRVAGADCEYVRVAVGSYPE